jgi:hypothetical protein
MMQPGHGQSRWAPGARLAPFNAWAAARDAGRMEASRASAASHLGASDAGTACFLALWIASTATLPPI